MIYTQPGAAAPARRRLGRALGGPAANLAVGCALTLAGHVTGASCIVVAGLMNVGIAIWTLMPIPSLDGWVIWSILTRSSGGDAMQRLRQVPGDSAQEGTMTDGKPECPRHSLAKTLVLHLGPGALLTIVFLLITPAVNRAGGSGYLALLLCIPLVLVPVEVGILLVERRRLGGSWRAVITGHHEPSLSFRGGLASVVLLYAVSMVAAGIGSAAGVPILRAAEGLLPAWAIISGLPADLAPSTLWFGLALSGVVAPVVEELYFRGFLLPRIPVGEAWAPAVNAALFSAYHFFAPWNYATIFAAFLPLAYYARRRGNLVPGIIVHVLFNSVGIIVALARLA
jgi:uncharacterized protein